MTRKYFKPEEIPDDCCQTMTEGDKVISYQTSDYKWHHANMGQPTKYRPKFCEAVIEIGRNGGWISEMAEACDVHRTVFDLWCDKHPEFLSALTRAKQLAQVWFEKKGQDNMLVGRGMMFNATMWKAQMCARHPFEYTDRKAVTHLGHSGGPIETISTTMTVQEAADLYADTLKKE
jgi:hypothetical protein